MFKKLKGKQNWIIELITCVIIFSLIICRNIGNLDEIWNFAFAKNAADGLTLYKDINTCVTPFSIDFMKIVLKIFGADFWTYRIMSCLIYGGCYLFGSRLLWKKTNKNLFAHMLYSIFFISMYSIMMYEYNILNVFLLLIVIFLETKEQNKEQKEQNVEHCSERYHDIVTNFLLGALVGLALMTKQSTGFVLFICMGINMFLNKKSRNDVVHRIAGFAIVIIGYFTYLSIIGAAPYILEFTVFGISNFTDNINLSLVLQLCVTHPELIVILIYYIINMLKIAINLFKKKDLTEEKKNRRTAFIYILASYCIVFPLLDYTHFAVASIPLLPFVFEDISKLLDGRKKASKITFYAFLGFWLFWSILLFDNASYSNQITCDINHYKGLNIDEEINKKMKNIIETLQKYSESGYDVYVLDNSAIAYLTPLDIYHKYFDLLSIGNTGTADIDKLITDICDEDNVILYLKDEETLNYQMPKNIKSILLENDMEVVDQCGHFNIYIHNVNYN